MKPIRLTRFEKDSDNYFIFVNDEAVEVAKGKTKGLIASNRIYINKQHPGIDKVKEIIIVDAADVQDSGKKKGR